MFWLFICRGHNVIFFFKCLICPKSSICSDRKKNLNVLTTEKLFALVYGCDFCISTSVFVYASSTWRSAGLESHSWGLCFNPCELEKPRPAQWPDHPVPTAGSSWWRSAAGHHPHYRNGKLERVLSTDKCRHLLVHVDILFQWII